MGKLRLLHLEIHPVFLDDDGENLTPIQSERFIVPASRVAGFSERWAKDFAVLQERHEANDSSPEAEEDATEE